MSYYDMTPSDVEREGATIGEEIEVCEQIHEEEFELLNGSTEFVSTFISGKWHTYHEVFIFECFEHQWARMERKQHPTPHFDVIKISCESIQESLLKVQDGKQFNCEYEMSKKLAVIWSKIATTMKTWKPSI